MSDLINEYSMVQAMVEGKKMGAARGEAEQQLLQSFNLDMDQMLTCPILTEPSYAVRCKNSMYAKTLFTPASKRKGDFTPSSILRPKFCQPPPTHCSPPTTIYNESAHKNTCMIAIFYK